MRKWNNPSVKLLIDENKSISDDPLEIIRHKSRQLILRSLSKGRKVSGFDLFALAEDEGIEVQPNQGLPDARIIPTADSYRIEFNPFQNSSRINFSIAHEIGHTLFPDCAKAVRNRETMPSPDQWELEFLCNVAASELLLPLNYFSKDIDGKIDSHVIIDIANKYNASIEAVVLRLAEVSNQPITIAIASYSEEGILAVEYSKRTKSSNLTIPKGYKIPLDSEVYHASKSGWTSESQEKWEIYEFPMKISALAISQLRHSYLPRVAIVISTDPSEPGDFDSIKIVSGDATLPQGDGKKIIVQLLNTSGAVGAGFGKAMANRYPQTKSHIQGWKGSGEFKLGNSLPLQIDDELTVFQMIAQVGFRPKKGGTTLRYDVLENALCQLAVLAIETRSTVHMPFIGAGQAGGQWEVIESIIHKTLIDNNIPVTIYKLPGQKRPSPSERSLSLFD